jgi:hypothetical protein
MQITAKLIQLLPLQTGTGKNGQWKKQEIIVETNDQYAKKICVAIWGDKADTNILQIGNQLKIDFDVESREYNGKWYTDVKAWRVEAADGTNLPLPNKNENITLEPEDDSNDLPF